MIALLKLKYGDFSNYIIITNARDRSRTDTVETNRGILGPVRLPIPPL